MLRRTAPQPLPKPTLPQRPPEDPTAVSRGAMAAALGSALVGAAIVAAIAMNVIGWQRRAIDAEYERLGRIVTLPVLVRALGVGEVVDDEDVARRAFPAALLPPGTILEGHALVGRTVLEPVLDGEPIRGDRLAPVGAAPGLEAIVPNGMRALQLDLQDDDRVSGFVTPGAHVDVLATFSEAGSHATETVTLVEALEVLAVDERIDFRSTGEPVRRPQVTLAVSPGDAERIVAVPRGAPSLKLTLRADVDFGDLHPPVVAADAARPDHLTVQQFRERFTEEDVARMSERLDAHLNPVRGAVIAVDEIRDPTL